MRPWSINLDGTPFRVSMVLLLRVVFLFDGTPGYYVFAGKSKSKSKL